MENPDGTNRTDGTDGDGKMANGQWPMADATAGVWSGKAAGAREAFLKALKDAELPFRLGQIELFQDADEKFIKQEVERMLFEPTLPSGGDFERKVVKRLTALAESDREILLHKGEFKALAAAGEAGDGEDVRVVRPAWMARATLAAWEDVLPRDPRNSGKYYTRTPIPEKAKSYAVYSQLREAARRAQDWELKWFCELKLAGDPVAVSDFTIKCIYQVVGDDGEVTRLVQLRNVVGEVSDVVELTAAGLHAPKNFREWCQSHGNFNWGAGEKDIQKLHVDIARQSAWKLIRRVEQFGVREIGKRGGVLPEVDGIWFFGDCAFDERGRPLGLDEKEGIYWHQHKDDEGNDVETGYKMAERGREAEFAFGKPMMRPNEKLAGMVEISEETWKALGVEAPSPNEEGRMKNEDGRLPMADGKGQTAGLKAPAVRYNEETWQRALFRELCTRLRRVVGSDEAFLVIGSFLAYAASPEIFAKHGAFPGMWVHGEAGSGKSTVVGWLMELFGFRGRDQGINLRGTMTKVGLSIYLDQYSGLPAWADEFRAGEVEPDRVALLHNAYNRGSELKFNPGQFQRKVRTGFVVSGESTSSDAATRGRYPHVQISKRQRTGSPAQQKEDFDWFNRNRDWFFTLGRLLMERRREFVRGVQQWMDAFNREDIDPRLKLVHGTGYAGWMAMVQMLESHSMDEVRGFRMKVVEHSKRAFDDVHVKLNVNVFMQDVLAAYLSEAIPNECFRVVEEEAFHPPGAPNQDFQIWKSATLYMDPAMVFMYLRNFLAKHRGTVPLDEKDMRDQLSKNPYWVRGKGDRDRIKMRFGKPGVKHNRDAWGISLDFHPMGYQECPDQEMAEWWVEGSRKGPDPRRGPLYAIVDGYLAWERQQEAEG